MSASSVGGRPSGRFWESKLGLGLPAPYSKQLNYRPSTNHFPYFLCNFWPDNASIVSSVISPYLSVHLRYNATAWFSLCTLGFSEADHSFGWWLFLKLILAPEPEDGREEMKGGETQISWYRCFISRGDTKIGVGGVAEGGTSGRGPRLPSRSSLRSPHRTPCTLIVHSHFVILARSCTDPRRLLSKLSFFVHRKKTQKSKGDSELEV